jgi:hypothetical protein
VEAHCIVAFSGELVSGSMDQVNLESFDLKGHTLIDSWFLMICIEVVQLMVPGHSRGCMV